VSDLHARITAAIDQAEALARRAWDAEPGRWALHHNQTRYGRVDEWEIRDYGGVSLAWVFTENDARFIVAHASPDVALRGLAEDRDILRRHAPNEALLCTPAIHTTLTAWVLCPEVLSVARRHGIEAS